MPPPYPPPRLRPARLLAVLPGEVAPKPLQNHVKTNEKSTFSLLAALGVLLGALGPLLAALGLILGALGPLLAALGRPWAAPGALLAALGALLAALGAILGRQKCSQIVIFSTNLMFTKPL